MAKMVMFAVTRLDLNENEPYDVISLRMKEDDKVAEVTERLRDVLELHDSDLILRLRNERGSVIPLNGKVAMTFTKHSPPLNLEVVKHFQSIEPVPNSLELTQYADSLKNKLIDIQHRIDNLEGAMENMREMRQEKIHQEMSKLEATVNFLIKRIEEAETIEWRGMFVKNPLW